MALPPVVGAVAPITVAPGRDVVQLVSRFQLWRRGPTFTLYKHHNRIKFYSGDGLFIYKQFINKHLWRAILNVLREYVAPKTILRTIYFSNVGLLESNIVRKMGA